MDIWIKNPFSRISHRREFGISSENSGLRGAPRASEAAGLAALMASVALLAAPASAELFEQSLSFSVSGAPGQVRIATVSGAKPDLIVASGTGRARPGVSILRNLGQGILFEESSVQVAPASGLVQSVVAADLNGDGLADFAVAGDDLGADPPATVVSIYLASSEGALSLAGRQILDGLFPRCIEAGDFNDDSNVDLAVCHSRFDAGAGRISLLAGSGSGTFAAATPIELGAQPSAGAVADLDGDGIDDLAVVDSLDDRLVVLFGGAPLPVTQASVAIEGAVAVASAGTGRLVVAATDPASTVTVTVSPSRVLAASAATQVSEGSAVAILTADFDNDTDLEVAVLVTDPDAAVLLNLDESGAVTVRETVSLGAEPDAFAAADLGGDDFVDLAISSASADRVFVFLNDGADLPAPALCAATPATVCASSEKSTVRIRNGSPDSKDNFRWKWQSPGNEINSGDPVGDRISYAFCFYSKDASGSVRLIQAHTNQTLCGGVPCWGEFRKYGGYRYSDNRSDFQGVSRVAMSANRLGSMKISVKGHGESLDLPDLPLADGVDTVAQLVNDRGACWETVFEGADSRSGDEFFVSKQRAAR